MSVAISKWCGQVRTGPAKFEVGRHLIEGLKNPTVVRNKKALEVFSVRPMRGSEAVARAIELSVGATDDAELTGLGGDVDNLVGEMEALRQALEETGGRGTAVA